MSKGKVISIQEPAMQLKTTVEIITRDLPLASLNPDRIGKLLKEQHSPDLSAGKLLKGSSLI